MVSKLPIQPASRCVRPPISTENAPGPLTTMRVPLSPFAFANADCNAATATCCPVGSKPGATVCTASRASWPFASNHTSYKRWGAFAGCQLSASFKVSRVGSEGRSGSINAAAGEPRSCMRCCSSSRRVPASKRCESSVGDSR